MCPGAVSHQPSSVPQPHFPLAAPGSHASSTGTPAEGNLVLVASAEVQRLILMGLAGVTSLALRQSLWQMERVAGLGLGKVPAPLPSVGGSEVLDWYSTGPQRNPVRAPSSLKRVDARQQPVPQLGLLTCSLSWGGVCSALISSCAQDATRRPWYLLRSGYAKVSLLCSFNREGSGEGCRCSFLGPPGN